MLGVTLPTTAGADISGQIDDAFTGAWPILVAMIGLGIVVKVIRKFTA